MAASDPARVPKLSTREEVMEEAARRGLHLNPSDIDMPEPGFPEIDGMSAREWLDAMGP